MMAPLAYWLEEFVGVDHARAAAWGVTIAAIALIAGAFWLVVNGG